MKSSIITLFLLFLQKNRLQCPKINEMKYLELEFTLAPYDENAADLLAALAAQAGLDSFAATGTGMKGYVQHACFQKDVLDNILSDFPMPCLDRFDLKIVVPDGISVSTADAYRGISPRVPEIPLREVLMRPVSEWKDLLVNDFEATVFAKYPVLASIRQSLYDTGAVYASMSGSGSALFALYGK